MEKPILIRKVDAISGTVDEGTGAVGLRAVLPTPTSSCVTVEVVKVVVPTIKEGCIIIPQAATYELQNRIFVYKVVDGKAKSTPVEVFRLNTVLNISSKQDLRRVMLL